MRVGVSNLHWHSLMPVSWTTFDHFFDEGFSEAMMATEVIDVCLMGSQMYSAICSHACLYARSNWILNRFSRIYFSVIV